MAIPYSMITIGADCSPAAALRNLGMRVHALPLDWIVSSVDSLTQCFQDRFARFHTQLSLNETRSRLIDAYGFEFPHDYPHTSADGTPCSFTEVGEGTIGEVTTEHITPEWRTYYPTVKAKYDRRIKRLLAILVDPKPVLVLCRWRSHEVKQLKMMLALHFQKSNVYFVNSTREPNEKEFPFIYNCFTEANGIWNQTEIWREGITAMASRIPK
jgi:hypothetical protein